MKKLINSLLLILMMSGVVACRSDFDPQEDGNHRFQKEKVKPMMKTVRMSFGGDYITESEEPLLRAEDGELFAGINVFRKDKNIEGASEEKYAYGLFKKSQGIDIDLITGYTYRFEATILIEQEDKLHYDKGYYEPFKIKDSKAFEGWPYESKLDEFQYTYIDDLTSNAEKKYLHQLSLGTSHIDINSSNGVYSYPRVQRYYGTLKNLDPEGIESVDIDMAYKCFALKIEIKELPSGYLTVSDVSTKNIGVQKDPQEKLVFPTDLKLGYNEPDSDTDYQEEWEGMYSMSNLLAEKETIKLQFVWHKGGNATKEFTCDIEVHPGKRKILVVNVSGTPNYNQQGKLNLNMIDEDLVDETSTINWDADSGSKNIQEGPQAETGE